MNTRFSALTREVWIAVGLSFILGLLVGWLVLGYAIFPVQYTNADPWDLNPAAKTAYVAMVADSFAVNHDLNLARERLRGFKTDDLTALVKNQIVQLNQKGQGDDAQRLGTFGVSYGLALAPSPSATPAPATGGSNLLGTLLPLLVALVVVIVLVAAGLLFYARVRAQDTQPAPRPQRRTVTAEQENVTMAPAAVRPMAPVTASPMSAAPRAAPISTPAPQPAPRAAPPPRAATAAKTLGTFAATYKFGDDNYDTAFTLETARNEFLGECGMGISETIGEGKPDKVTAFDLWLFDKSDVRTVTQILMTEYAYNDQTLRSRLAQKGELTLAEKGKHIPLQTATLRVDATIVDLVYASTPGLAPNSHFQKLIVEMVATQK